MEAVRDIAWRARLGATLAALGTALALGSYLAGFTVDDAWISVRYATHLRAGVGYRFQLVGPPTDGVTPLGWAHLLAPFAVDAHAAMFAARTLGVLSTALTVVLSVVSIERVARDGALARLAHALVVLNAPLLAYASSGMETPVVTALVTAGLFAGERGRARLALAPLALAAGLRPELLPAMVGLAVVSGAAREPGVRAGALRGLVVCAPFVAVALVRAAVFGRPAPLSALAKAPSPSLGAMYALACVLLAGPLALLAPWALVRASKALALAAVAALHVLAVGFAGGDWMPLSRLFVPLVPVVALAAAYLLAGAGGRALPTVLLAVAGQLFALVRVGPSARRVFADRAVVMRELASALARCEVVATLDVGWVGVVHPGAIVDLAGVTDPVVAALPGGHTTRALQRGFLERRGVDCLVLLVGPEDAVEAAWWRRPYARWAERFVAWELSDDARFVVAAESSAGESLHYVVVAQVAAEGPRE